MSIVLLIIVALIVVGVCWLFMQPASYEVVRRRVIKVKPEEIYPLVADFKHWSSWSPWVMHEPNTTIEYGTVTDAKDGWYAWEGQHIGAGKMVHQSLIENESIEQELEFYRPMKSNSHVYWRFNAIGDHTEVTWGMRGKMPFLFRWMSKMMDGFVGKDYEIGLGRLAMQAGDMSDPFEIEFLGDVEIEAQDYLGSHFAGKLEDMKLAMNDQYPKVMQAAVDNGMAVNGPPFALYHEFDKQNKLVICDIAVPVVEAKHVEGLISGTLLGQKYTRTTLKGDYSHLEKTWYSAFSHVRMCKSKLVIGRPMVERYMSDPTESDGLDLVTYLDLPIK
jgi:predicted transcriptional regulator YdeE